MMLRGRSAPMNLTVSRRAAVPDAGPRDASAVVAELLDATAPIDMPGVETFAGLDAAAERDLIDFAEAMRARERTNFRRPSKVMAALRAKHRQQRF